LKICGITTGDSEAAMRQGATAIGFKFYPSSPRYISPGARREIAGRRAYGAWVFIRE